MEAINEFYLEDGHLERISNYTKDSNKGIIYEVLRVINYVPLFSEEHISRMEKSFRLMNKSFAYEYSKIQEFLNRLIQANNVEFGNVKITFDIENDTMKVFSIKHSYPTEEMYKEGVKTILFHGERKNPNAKVVDLDFRKNVTEAIDKNKAFEAILINNEGFITEGSKSNIFIIKGNDLITSPIDQVLPGVTRGRILKVAKKIGISIIEKKFKYSDLDGVDAMFISGTSPKILPISKVDNIEMDINNIIMRNLIIAFNEDVESYIKKRH